MERLGLWGDGATFKSFEEFIDIVQRKGLGKCNSTGSRMPLVSVELPSCGHNMYLCVIKKPVCFDLVIGINHRLLVLIL